MSSSMNGSAGRATEGSGRAGGGPSAYLRSMRAFGAERGELFLDFLHSLFLCPI